MSIKKIKNLFYFLLTFFIPIHSSFFVLSKKKEDIKYAIEYIKKYSSFAIEEMEKYGIPASIKLSQGMVESDNGKSILSKKTNNHFGIKCGKDWIGEKYHYDDDLPKECFRKYSSVKESFNDHSKFLKKRRRYSKLFTISVKDYQSWSKELKKAGYATSVEYTNVLIRQIEKYFLWKLDEEIFYGIEKKINSHLKLILRKHNQTKFNQIIKKIRFLRKFIFIILKRKLNKKKSINDKS